MGRPAETPGHERRPGQRDGGGGQGAADQQRPGADREWIVVVETGRVEEVDRVELSAADHDQGPGKARLSGGGRHPEVAGQVGQPAGQALLEPERWVDSNKIGRQPFGGRAQLRVELWIVQGDRGPTLGGNQNLLRRAIAPEPPDLGLAAGAERPQRRPPRSRATARRPRWIRTRTAPSERPRMPAISAVDISSTKRRTRA